MKTAIVATLLPFLWRAATYAWLGSYVPIAVFVACAALAAIGLRGSGAWARRALRAWCLAMIAWALARFIVLAAVVADVIPEAHVAAQLNPLFASATLGYLAAGVLLFRQAGRADVGPASGPPPIAVAAE